MNLSFFDQFMSPTILGIPLVMVAMIYPWLLFPYPTNKWLNNRLTTLQVWFSQKFTKQLFTPVNMKGHKWAMMFLSLMVFIIMINLLGLLPYTFTPTTQLSLNLGLAIPFWLMTVLIGLRNQPTMTFGHLLPEGTPTLLIPILIMIESVSLIIRPLALGVRLTANLTAGHLLIQLIATATLVLLPIMPLVSFMTMFILFLLTLLEIAVAMIQAYVFVLLLSLYLQENV
uniref:ATP synthase subunit a n=2 Tax=Onychodactylus TaxID=113381 RepID=A0A0E3DEJ8_9AMPH|nr:ATP synthase F0 subunit 6 [Onychodactylus zhaoermii]YP_626691.1 ATP synthase F0 subunit 6 [Onychodactylus fischeri]ABC56104.1 ATP synthase F0 subunit 6 [Onychodactylus fischeri]AIC83076.1 ATP synthase F0 subunit 6 [Onychodactylus zhaoermii]UHM25430.1 ATP synthase F0 subunit 6 [Onychodactylus zhaoermii]UHM25443.1 ATP synthase F0 subunit 6 [Onychodactylus zhaoermii]UHM25456.1 ATP synthase F0 subunit 6 [Onychodactylus zhaoermii]